MEQYLMSLGYSVWNMIHVKFLPSLDEVVDEREMKMRRLDPLIPIKPGFGWDARPHHQGGDLNDAKPLSF